MEFNTNGETPSIVLGFSQSLNFSTVATVPSTRPSGKQFFWKNAKLTRNPFVSLSIARNEEQTVRKSVLCW